VKLSVPLPSLLSSLVKNLKVVLPDHPLPDQNPSRKYIDINVSSETDEVDHWPHYPMMRMKIWRKLWLTRKLPSTPIKTNADDPVS